MEGYFITFQAMIKRLFHLGNYHSIFSYFSGHADDDGFAFINLVVPHVDRGWRYFLLSTWSTHLHSHLVLLTLYHWRCADQLQALNKPQFEFISLQPIKPQTLQLHTGRFLFQCNSGIFAFRWWSVTLREGLVREFCEGSRGLPVRGLCLVYRCCQKLDLGSKQTPKAYI